MGMTPRIFNFQAEVDGDVPAYKTYPVYDSLGKLAGGFLLVQDCLIKAFLAGTDHQMALTISVGDSFYFTPQEGPDGKVNRALITDKKISVHSKLIKGAAEEGTNETA